MLLQVFGAPPSHDLAFVKSTRPIVYSRGGGKRGIPVGVARKATVIKGTLAGLHDGDVILLRAIHTLVDDIALADDEVAVLLPLSDLLPSCALHTSIREQQSRGEGA